MEKEILEILKRLETKICSVKDTFLGVLLWYNRKVNQNLI